MMELSRETSQQLSEIIHKLCGLVLGPDKSYLIRHRLEPVVRGEDLAGFDEFLRALQGRGGERLHDAIIEAITTKETSFFRDRALFDALQGIVLPELVDVLRHSGGKRHRIRIWSAGCSTGQEPYSIAMMLRDFAVAQSDERVQSQFTILGSDISATAIEVAKAGRYSKSEIDRGISESMLIRHFHPHGQTWALSDEVRRLVQFQKFDLMQCPGSLGAFDLIFCRNVLIYFDEQTRRQLCDVFHRMMHPGGWLVVGAAESLFGIETPFESISMGRVQLYRKP